MQTEYKCVLCLLYSSSFCQTCPNLTESNSKLSKQHSTKHVTLKICASPAHHDQLSCNHQYTYCTLSFRGQPGHTSPIIEKRPIAHAFISYYHLLPHQYFGSPQIFLTSRRHW